MKNVKVSVFDVAQWSKLMKSEFEKKLTIVSRKKAEKGSVVKISAFNHEKWQKKPF